MGAHDAVARELVYAMGIFFITFVSYWDDTMSLPRRIVIHAVSMMLVFLIMGL